MRSKISLEVKAAAMSDLALGIQPAVVAERYGLNRQTVKSWRATIQPVIQPDMEPVVHQIRPQIESRQQTLSELVEANLRAKLVATQRIAEHATRDEWLNNQSAADVAELFKIIDLSAIGILDRLASAQRSALPGPGIVGSDDTSGE